MSFKAELTAAAGWSWSDGATDNGRLEYGRPLGEGQGTGQAEAVWHCEGQSLAENDTIALDLRALQRTVLGAPHTVSFLAVKALVIVHQGGEGTLRVGGGGGAEWFAPFGAEGDQLLIPPHGAVFLGNPAAGWPVAVEHCKLQMAASGGAVSWAMAVVGTRAE
jgi:hypothetical protein